MMEKNLQLFQLFQRFQRFQRFSAMASFFSEPRTGLQEEGETHEREATELQGTAEYARTSHSRVLPQATVRSHQTPSWKITIDNFWRRQVVATVPHDKCRDHFGTDISFLLFKRL